MDEARPKLSIIWVAADTGGVAIVSLLAMLVMARFIGPEGFGTAALAMGIVLLANLYAEGLLHDALIRYRETGEDSFRQAFWLQFRLGMAMTAAFAIGGVVISETRFATLAWPMAIMSFSLPFSGMLGIANARLRRDLRFREVAIPSVVSKLASSLLGILLAWHGIGLWALIVQAVVAVIVQFSLQTAITRWFPAPTMRSHLLRPLWKFVIPYNLMHTLVGARIQIFTALVAAVVGLSAAGFINVAFRLTLMPQIILTTAITSFALPMLAPHQDAPEALLKAFHEVTRLITIIMLPIFVGIALCAPGITRVMLGAQWMPSVLPMRIFALSTAIYMLRMSSSVLMRAKGFVKFSMINAIVHFIITVGGMLLFRPDDPSTAALLWLAPAIPLLPATLLVVKANTGFSIPQQLSGSGPALLACAAMAAAVLGFERAVLIGSPALALGVSIIIGAVAYALTIVLIEPDVLRVTQRLIRRR